MTRVRAIVLALVFGCLCIALASRFAEAQYSPAGGNTFGGLSGLSGGAVATGPGTGVTTLYLGDANYLDGQLPSGFQQAQTMGQCISGTTATASGINLDAACVTGTLASANQQAQTMGGCAAGTTNSVTGLELNDAACVSGALLVANGGTGVTSLQGGIALTKPCDLNGPTGAGACSYWNADLGVTIGDAATIAIWADQCNGYTPSQAINAQQPTWTANAWGSRHGVTWTANGTQALATNTSAAFSGAMTFGATFVPAANTNQAYILDMPNGSVGGKISFYRLASSGAMTCNTGATLGANAQYISSRPADWLCNNSLAQGANGSLLSSQSLQAGVTNSIVGAGGSNTSDGGIVLGNEWDGGSNSFAGTIFSILACTRELTRLESDAYKSYQSTYYGGI